MSSNLRPVLSGILQAYRQKNGLSQESAAQKIGLSLRYYQRLEKQEMTASLETVVMICNQLDIKPSKVLDVK